MLIVVQSVLCESSAHPLQTASSLNFKDKEGALVTFTLKNWIAIRESKLEEKSASGRMLAICFQFVSNASCPNFCPCWLCVCPTNVNAQKAFFGEESSGLRGAVYCGNTEVRKPEQRFSRIRFLPTSSRSVMCISVGYCNLLLFSVLVP